MNNGTRNLESDEQMLIGQAKLWKCLYGSMDGAAIRCAVELGIADIINARGRPMSLSQIAHTIASPTLNTDGLSRLMRFLVHRKIFDSSSQPGEDDGEGLYSLNNCSKWLLRDFSRTMAPLAMMSTDPLLRLPFYALSRSIEEGVSIYKKTYGEEMWAVASHNPDFNRVFNQGMASAARITTGAVISCYASGFLGLKGDLVDVGGGVGVAISEIVKAYPHLKGINFDLPHVVATASKYNGVTHVGGDMFKAIPPADSIFMQWILHDWGDEDCIKILKNCRKAIPKRSGKVIIVDVVLQPGGDGLFDDTSIVFDLVMFASFSGGKERTEGEWKKILEEGGFPRYEIIKIPALQSIIVAYPQ